MSILTFLCYDYVVVHVCADDADAVNDDVEVDADVADVAFEFDYGADANDGAVDCYDVLMLLLMFALRPIMLLMLFLMLMWNLWPMLM